VNLCFLPKFVNWRTSYFGGKHCSVSTSLFGYQKIMLHYFIVTEYDRIRKMFIQNYIKNKNEESSHGYSWSSRQAFQQMLLTVQFSYSVVSDSATPRTVACQASSITNFWSLLKLRSIQLVMPSNHLILCHPLLLPALLSQIALPHDFFFHWTYISYCNQQRKKRSCRAKKLFRSMCIFLTWLVTVLVL